MRRRRGRAQPSIWASLVGILAATLFLLALFSPASEPENHTLLFNPRPALEILILVGAVALLALLGRSLPTLIRYAIALLVLLAAALNLADAVMPGLFGREVDLYWDFRQVPGLLGLYAKSAGLWHAILAVALAILAATAGFFLIASALRLIAWASTRRSVALAAIALAVAATGAAALPRGEEAEAPVSTALSREIAREIATFYRAWQVARGHLGKYAGVLAAPQPVSADLAKLKHRDVFLIFFESYGTVVLDNPQYRAHIAPALARFEEKMAKSGVGLLSNRILSPTFGGGSWVAHGTMLSGIKLDPFLSRLVLESKRKTLPGYMAEAGYRTVNLQPGIKNPLAESRFWGFEKNYYGADLDYRGPEFGWFGIPDQFTLKKLATREMRVAEKPLFAQIVLVSSHTPFYPLPPYRADWADAGDYVGVTPQEWEEIYRQPDWNHLEGPFLDSLVYDFDVLGDFVATRVADGALVVILGDEQPPAFLSGAGQPWTVPITILSRDPDLLAPFAARGYTRGVIPDQPAPWQGMESFMPNFLEDFSTATPRLAAQPDNVPPKAE
jgi:hypothetical protein